MPIFHNSVPDPMGATNSPDAASGANRNSAGTSECRRGRFMRHFERGFYRMIGGKWSWMFLPTYYLPPTTYRMRFAERG